ncbi:MAG: hypothetical protein GWN58_68515 [Anaerolineae bacterium]|nr:hypothetical protein [Anaerolineae bacterium]
MQHFEFPLAAFAAENPNLETENLVQVRLVFDRSESGAVVLDDIGFRD